MATTKRLLCLANSKKKLGRCIAGREIVAAGAGPWIRPVSARTTEEVSENERQYEDRTDPRLLDVVDVSLLEHVPHACQTENWLLDPGYRWRRIRGAGWSELQTHVENPPTLWINGHSTVHGKNSEIPLLDADKLPRSLYLIHVGCLELHVFAPNEGYGDARHRVQGRFQHGAATYGLWITDPHVEREYQVRGDGHYEIGESCLTVSLTGPYLKKNGTVWRSKLIAAVLQREGKVEP